jgi:uncharacterized membrane protein YhaH (DUF805 family)
MDPFSLVAAEEEPAAADLASGAGAMARETFYAFVAALLLAQAGLFATSLGLLLGWFRGQWLLGGGLAVGGVAALLATAAIVRWHDRRD